MNGPGGRPIIASAAYRAFPYPGARTVADLDAAKAAAKVRRELNGLMLIERANRAKLSHNIPHNLTYRDNRIPASHLPCAGRALIQRTEGGALFISERN